MPETGVASAGAVIDTVGRRTSGGGGTTVSGRPGEGASRFPAVSVARLMIAGVPAMAGVQANDQDVVPDATAHVAPLSVDTSTFATWPPPVSLAVPVIVVGRPVVNEAPAVGAVIAEAGGIESTMPGTRPVWSE